MKREILNTDWIEKITEDPQFKENLTKLGEFEYYDDDLEEPVIYKYWTETRWKISKILGTIYVLSPAFWNDEQLEARFALYCGPNFNLLVYVKIEDNDYVVGEIGCHKILVDYDFDSGPSNIRRLELSPKDELLATIQNLDYFFTEQIPQFMSFDYNIVYQALRLIIDKGLASFKLLTLRCNEIKEILSQLIKKEDDDNDINPQIYIQIKALLDFEPGKWISELIGKYDIFKYFEKMLEIEESEVKIKIWNVLISTEVNSKSFFEVIKNLIGKLSQKGENARIIAEVMACNFDRLSEMTRNQLLLILSKEDKSAGLVAGVLADNFNKLPEMVRNQLLVILSEKDTAAEFVLQIITNNFNNLSERIRNVLLRKLSEKVLAAGDFAVFMGKNYNRLPNDIKDLLFNLINKDEVVGDVGWAIANNFDEFPANLQKILLLKLSEKKKFSNDVLWILEEVYESLDEDFLNLILIKLFIIDEFRANTAQFLVENFNELPKTTRKLFFKFIEKKEVIEDVSIAIIQNFDLLPNEITEMLYYISINDENAKDLAKAIVNNFNKLTEIIRNKLLLKLYEKKGAIKIIERFIIENLEKLPKNIRNKILKKNLIKIP